MSDVRSSLNGRQPERRETRKTNEVEQHYRQQRTRDEQWQAAQAYAGAQKGWEYPQRARAAVWSIGSNGSTMSDVRSSLNGRQPERRETRKTNEVEQHYRQQRTRDEQWQAAQANADTRKGWEYAQRARAAAWSSIRGSSARTLSSGRQRRRMRARERDGSMRSAHVLPRGRASEAAAHAR